jgi:hypothetical protein
LQTWRNHPFGFSSGEKRMNKMKLMFIFLHTVFFNK